MVIAGIAFSVAAAGAAGDTLFIRPGPCQADQTYLLAANSGAIIQVNADTPERPETSVIVFRKRDRQGWASQRLLKRFDLRVEPDGVSIINSGAFCREKQ
ncbi:hypothetical protein PUV54_13775 [Hyphococcus flavus]|uniref:Uncharacterized protein n=1 Tax=Hyphococcus flavus TaxID=1866326 RepID=A0AAE9ZEB5_9PROT|nr:hypothetical protein [Hyphococcus flavus]WDI31022.1 hypothetical protein PUV54_13775 [Hyphococcus flavus]